MTAGFETHNDTQHTLNLSILLQSSEEGNQKNRPVKVVRFI